MGLLKVQIVDGQLTLVPDDEAQTLLNSHAGDVLGLTVEDGRLTLSPSVSHAERVARGKAFLERYRQTFEALAK